MKVFKFAALIFLVSLVAFGCTQKKQDMANLPGLGMEGEDKDMVQTVTSPEVIESQPAAVQAQVSVQPMQPAGQPIEVATNAVEAPVVVPVSQGLERNKQIQTALKNANLYFGEVDGKLGPLTRKAIEEFQKMKGLKVDGKVGPITWGELQKYLNVQPSAPAGKAKR